MNESLTKVLLNGTYKQIRRDTAGQPANTEANDDSRRQLHLAYYGIVRLEWQTFPGRGFKICRSL